MAKIYTFLYIILNPDIFFIIFAKTVGEKTLAVLTEKQTDRYVDDETEEWMAALVNWLSVEAPYLLQSSKISR